MAKQIIDIGVQGNDGTGDSIRESFRKVNENFSEIYAIFGVEGAINFTDLSDAPSSYSSNQIIMANLAGDKLTARTIVTEGALLMDDSDETKLTLSVGSQGLSDDTSPSLSYSLNANGLSIFNMATPSQTIAQNLLEDNPGIGANVNAVFDKMVINKEYADDHYLQVDTNGAVTGPLLVRDEPQFPNFVDPNYDPDLTGNFLKNEAVQRQHVVYRGGDSMTGPLTLSDHPAPLQGYGTPNGIGDLQAATKFYVDNQTFSSAVNLYVSQATGDDLQQRTPVGKEGRFWQYAYKSIGAACLAAENLQDIANIEPGPYRQRLSYTIGPDQYFSTITDRYLQDGNTAVTGYQDAFDLLQLNRAFIQAETIAYVNNKYVNTFSYDKAKCQRDVGLILDAIGYDIVLGTNFNSNRAATFYFNGTGEKTLGTQLIQTIEAIKYVKESLINYSYDNTALSVYVGQIIDALCFDLVLKSNYRSLQMGNLFPYSNADISVAELVEVLLDLQNNILELPAVSSIPAAVTSIQTNINGIINVVTGDDFPEVIFAEQPDSTVGQLSARDLLIANIPFLQAETVAYLGAEFPNLSYDRTICKRDIKYIIWSLTYDFMYGGNSQSVFAGLRYWDGLQQLIASYEVTPFLALLEYMKTLISDVVKSDSPSTVYQQSVKQYRNETLLEGEDTIPSVISNIDIIKSIITDSANAPAVVQPTFTSAAQVLKDARTAILANKSNFQVAAISYVEANFPVINDPGVLTEISDRIDIIVNLLTLGIASRSPSEYNPPSGISDGYQDAKTLAMANLDFIADEAYGWLVANYPSYVIDEAQFKQHIVDCVEASIYDLYYGGNSAARYKGLQLENDGFGVIEFLEALSFAGSLLTLNVIQNTAPGTTYSSTPQYIDAVLYPDGGIAGTPLGLSFSYISTIADGGEGPTLLNPSLSAYNPTYVSAKNIIDLNRNEISVNTTDWLDENYKGGFNYDEAVCYRDVGLIVDAMSIDIITGGTYQSINAGKSYYRNASARAIAIGTQYKETLDAIKFAKELHLQVLNQTSANRFQTLVPQVFNPAKIASPAAIADLVTNVNTMINIIEGGVGVAPTPTYGTGIWNIVISNGGNGYVDQGSPGNNDIIAAKVLVGIDTAAYGSIVKYTPGTSATGDTIQVRLTKPGFFNIGEQIEFGETVQDQHITIFVESGIYFEDYPIRLPANTSIKGDEFRRTIVRPKDRISQSPWRKVFFYRDAVIDALELGPINYDFDYATNAAIDVGGTTNKIVITLGTGQVPGSWVGKILMDDYGSVSATGTSSTNNRITTSSAHGFNVNDPVIFRGTEFGGIEAGKIYYVVSTPSSTTFTVTEKIGGTVKTLSTATGSILVMRSDRRGKAIIDSVSGNFMNCSVIYPFNAATTLTAGNWHLYDPLNYGRHYLTNPLDSTSEAKNNKLIDAFLCNDQTRISNMTFQGHGGFAMVLDPEGQIKTKSPYGQVCSSFSQSNNRKRFAGGQFVDGFTGRLRGTIVAIEYDGIENYKLNELIPGSGYLPLDGTYTYNDVAVSGLTRTATNTYAATKQIKVDSVVNLVVGGAITFSGSVFGGIEAGKRYYITNIDAPGGELIKVSKTQGGDPVTLTNASGSMSCLTGGTGATANVTVTDGLVTNIVSNTPGEYYKEGEWLTVDNSLLGGVGSGLLVPVFGTNGKGTQITVRGAVNSGLDLRPPQPPCAFFVEGSRYQINDVLNWNPNAPGGAEVVLKLDTATPYNAAGFYNNETCYRDTGLILDAVTYDLVIGSNYQTVKAGLSYTRSTAALVLTNQRSPTVAGLNYARDLAVDELTDSGAITSLQNSMAVINTIIEQGITAAPAVTYPTVSGLTTTDAEKLKNNIVANRAFIQNEIVAYVAATFNLKNYPTYSAVKASRDIGYAIDAIVYDIMYGGNSMTYDIAESYYSKLTLVSAIEGVESIYVDAMTRLTTVLQQIALNTPVTKSNGNILTQTINAGYVIGSGTTEYGKISTLVDIVKDYVADGDFDSSTTRTAPAISGVNPTLEAQKDLVDSAKETIQQSVIDFLNDGGLLGINIEMGGNKSMLANDFAMINDLGYAIVCKNGGVSEQVSTFTYYCHTHYWAADGGQIRSVAGSNAHGTYGLRATGYDITEKPDSVNLANDMAQVARVYKQGQFASEMTPTATKQALSVYIYGYSYIPTNTSELEIDHSMAGGNIVRYEISSIEHTVVTIGQNILKLNLSTAGNNGTSSTGLSYALYDGQMVVIRALQNIKFNNIANVNPTRPSTALQYNDNLADIYRILAYNLNDSTGELLASNVSILQSDSSFNYYKFTTDLSYLGALDLAEAIAITGVSGDGTTVTVTFDAQASAPYTVGEFITVQDVIDDSISTTAYNGAHRVTACTTTQVQFASTVTATYIANGYVGSKTQGSRVGDNKIAVLEISQATTINQINKGIYLFGWHGRTHRIASYTLPEKIAQAATFVSWTPGTRTLLVETVSGTIVPGMILSGTGWPVANAVYVESVEAPVFPATSYTIVVNTATGVTSPSGTITFGVPRNGFLNIDPNPLSNISGDGTTIPALSYVSKVVPTSGLKFVTYDVAWTPNSLPIVDNWYKFAGQATAGYNWWRQISSATSQTTIAVSDITGLQVGMIVTSLSPGAYIPNNTIIQSINSTKNTFTVSPACWVPAGATVSSTVVATVASITITNAGSGYTSAPVLTFTGGSPTVQAIATCTVKNGSIETVTVVSPGYGYTSQPTITLSYGNAVLTPVLTSSPTVNTTASAGISTNRITVAYESDPGSFTLNDYAEITGVIDNGSSSAGTTLSVTNVVSGVLKVGMRLIGDDISPDTYITALGSGSGGTGTYTVSVSQLITARAMTASTSVTAFNSKSGPSTFTGSISGTTLSATWSSGTIAVGQKISGTGVAPDTYITANLTGVGTTGASTWTVSKSQTVGSGTAMTTDYAVELGFNTEAVAPSTGVYYRIKDSNNPLYNGLYYAVKSTTSSITLNYPYDPGTWNSAITASAFSSKTGTGPYLVTITIPTQAQLPTIGSYWVVTGNATSAYNGTFVVTDSSETTITLSYPSDPGSYGLGTTTLTPVVTLAKQSLSATSSQLGITKPFSTASAATLRIGYASGTAAQITTRISTCRATGHDFLDIGTGGYSTTNYPYQIYGNPTQSKQQANEVYEEGVGRVFYVTTDQNGIFRVGRFFTVDQGTGTVTFSASIALSNLDGLGFKRGVVVSEFSTDSSMTNNAPEIVPVQSAVRGYIDKRLGLDHGGGPVALSNLVGPGYLALNGALTMKGNLNMGTFAIANVATPLVTDPGTNAANKTYVDTAVAAFDEFRELRDVQWTSLVEGNIPVYDQSTVLNVVGGLGNGTSITINFLAQAAAPFPIGSIIVVSGINPTQYNGTYIVTGCTTTSVSYASTVTASYASGGTIVANKWRNIMLPDSALTSDVLLTYNGTTGKITSAIQANKIVNSMVSPTAAIAQSKLAMNAATTRANATGIAQADLGLASFKSIEFDATNGWISLKDSSSTTTGIVYSKLQYASQGTVLGRGKVAGTGNIGEITFGNVVSGGDGIKNAQFGSGPTAQTGFAMLVSYDGSSTDNNTYGTVGITTTGEANRLVKTDGSQNISTTNGYVNAASFLVGTKKFVDSNLSTNSLQFYTPGGFNYSSSVGTSSVNTTTTMLGVVDITGGTLKSTTLTSGGTATTGTITGAWQLSASSSLDLATNSNNFYTKVLSTGADTTSGSIQGYWSLTGSSRLQATYADLAEFYEGDREYKPGMVLVFGGEKEVTTTTQMNDTRAAGIVTTNPAYVMNSEQTGIKVCIALAGRVPCWVVGRVKKGDLLTTATTVGCAMKANNPQLGSIIGKALEDKDSGEAGIIQVAVGRV